MNSHEAAFPLPSSSIVDRIASVRALQNKLAGQAQPVILLALRVLFGSAFMITGWGKFQKLDQLTGFFVSLGIPFAELNAPVVATVELVGGLLLILGLASRLVSVPLLITMAVALGSAHAAELSALFSDPGTFISAAPVPFAVALLAILGFGPGKLSVDQLLARRYLDAEREIPDDRETS